LDADDDEVEVVAPARDDDDMDVVPNPHRNPTVNQRDDEDDFLLDLDEDEGAWE
jgi:hypothetical protein